MKNKNTERRSPIKQAPLRRPGQSIREAIHEIQFNDGVMYAMLLGMSVTFLILVWIVYLFPSSSKSVWFTTTISIFAIVISLWRLRGYKRTVDNLQLGLDGELEVAENLEDLKKEGNIVFHDLLGNGFNVDHVILSRKGVFVIETKTRRKTSTSMIEYDGINIKVDGHVIKEDFIQQAAAEASWISSELESGTGKKYPIRPIIVFPGWFVKGSGTALQSEIWVLNPKAMVKIIQQQSDVLKGEDVRLAAYFLSRLNR